MQIYLAFHTLKCAVSSPALETGNVLERGKEHNSIPRIKNNFYLNKSEAIY